MTAEEFIENYSWEWAREIQADMLAHGSRRPEEWSFKEKDGARITIMFDGCPFRLKSAGMVDWLRALLLYITATNAKYGFNAIDCLWIGTESIVSQIDGGFWVFEPYGSVQNLREWILRVEAEDEEYEQGVDWIALVNGRLLEKIESGELSYENHWEHIKALLQCKVYYFEYFVKTGKLTDLTQSAMGQLRIALDENIDVAKEDDEYPDFSVEDDAFNQLIEMIPKIESVGNNEVTAWCYEFTRDFYNATRRFTLANKYQEKLDRLTD